MDTGFQIVHVIDSLGIGGAQAMMFSLYRAIEQYYPQITQNIILTNAAKIDKRYVKDYDIPYSPMVKSLLPRTLFELQEIGPVVMLYHKLMCSDTSFFRHIFPRVPVVLVNHTFTKHFIYNRIANCNAIVTVSKHMVGTLKRLNPKHRYEVIRNGIDGASFDNVSPMDREGEEPGCFMTGRINALNKIKHSDQWLKWVTKVNLPVKMVHEYIGGGFYLKRSLGIVEKLNQKHPHANEVRLLGPVQIFQEKVSRLKSWDITLYEINRDEGISISLLESLACGVPVICSDHYGNKEIIKNGVNGFIFESRGELKEILTELCLNRDMLQALRVSTKQHFQDHLDVKQTAQKYVELLDRVIEKSGEASRMFAHPGSPITKNSQKHVLPAMKSIRKRVSPKKAGRRR